jgi:mutator protein MutT
MSQDDKAPLRVSALIVTRSIDNNPVEVLNVLAHNKTKFGFPGGKLEEAESPEDAVIRETEEELGVTPTNIEFKGVYEALTTEDRGIQMYVYTGKVTSDITPTNEIAEIHWLSYEQMVNNIGLLTPMTIEHILPMIKDL